MNRVITIIVLATFFPMQLYALDFSGFNKDTQIEYFVPTPTDKAQEPIYPTLDGKMLEEAPKGIAAGKSGTNWWLWGGIGLAVIAGGIAALAGGGGGGGGGTTSSPTGSSTVSW